MAKILLIVNLPSSCSIMNRNYSLIIQKIQQSVDLALSSPIAKKDLKKYNLLSEEEIKDIICRNKKLTTNDIIALNKVKNILDNQEIVELEGNNNDKGILSSDNLDIAIKFAELIHSIINIFGNFG